MRKKGVEVEGMFDKKGACMGGPTKEGSGEANIVQGLVCSAMVIAVEARNMSIVDPPIAMPQEE